ncbi:FtsX-like permease family protein [Patescibacteria group bacterium]|nr:MAG: FtsX-like permease family protein [Patescibacteria group bacterium]
MFYKLWENIKLAFISIWSNKVRALLTMLGVIIGVFAVVELLAIGEGVKSFVTKEIEGLGSNLIAILPGKMESGQFNPSSGIGVSTLTNDDVRVLKEDVSSIEAVSPMMLISSPIKYGDKSAPSALVLGATPDIFKVRDTKLDSGRVFEQKDEDEKERVIVLGYPIAQSIFGDENAIGKKVIIRGEEIEVIGVLEKPKQSASPFGGQSFDDAVYLPFSAGIELTNTEQVFRIVAKIKSDTDVKEAKEEIKKVILKNHKDSEDFTVFTQEDMVDLVGTILDVMRALLGALGAISLLVGGIGIMNIMLVSVTERTREIGIRKAIGASQLDILIQFLIESLILSLLGGGVGLGLSFGAAYIVKTKADFEPVITPEFIILAIAFSVLIGVIFGVAPAIRAARLDPIKALKYE